VARVRELACYRVDIPPQKDTYVMSHGRELTAFPSTVVKVTADDGTVGYGEACTLGSDYLDGHPGSARATIKLLAEFAIDCPVFDANVLADGMDELVVDHLPGKAAIDVAVWDLRGKLLGLPVAALLGGVKKREIDVFQAISLGSPQDMADQIRDAATLGYRCWQLKLGDDPVLDAERTHAVFEVLPESTRFVTCDANKGWTVAQTLRYLDKVRSLDIYLEQPCPTLAELAAVKAATPVPMMVDESVRDVSDLIAATSPRCADALNLKIVRVGGLTKAARIRDVAQALGIEVLVDDPQGADLSTAAMVHLAATIQPRHLLAASNFTGPQMKLSYQPAASRGAFGMTGGTLTCPDRPGLGIEIDEAVLGEPIFVVER
jgi:L-alanine-DL-glutamate epimerase-like enolase superfamily enzyme